MALLAKFSVNAQSYRFSFPRACPDGQHLAQGIYKSSFISTVRSTFHTNPSRNFSNTRFKPEEFENARAFRFHVEEKHFENGVSLGFRKRWRLDDHVISEFSSNTNPK